MSKVCTKIIFIKKILEFLGINIEFPITVHCNNVGAIFLANNAKNSQRTKHVDIHAHYVQQYVENGTVKIIFVKLENNAVDLYMKNVLTKIFDQHTTSSLGSVNEMIKQK